MNQWEDLICSDCGGKLFTQMVNLAWKEGAGSTVRPAGYHCVGCQKPADMAALIKSARGKELDRQMKELEAQR